MHQTPSDRCGEGEAGRPVVFALRFLTVSLVFFLLLEHPLAFVFEPINLATTRLVTLVLHGLGFYPKVSGTILSLQGFSVQVVGECSAVFLFLLVAAFLVSYPSSIRSKLTGAAFMFPVIALVNALRIAAIFLTGVYAPSWFDTLHLFLGQVLMIALSFGLCLFWLGRLDRQAERDGALRLIARLLIFSLPPFFLWLWLNKAYVSVNYAMIKTLLSLFGIEATVPGTIRIYPDTFITVNLVVVTMLLTHHILSGIRSGRGPHGLAATAFFSYALVLGSNGLLFLVASLFYTFREPVLIHVVNALLVVNEWLLPFGIWLSMHHDMKRFRLSEGFQSGRWTTAG
ncbi:exosortase/archaeosortase family protein [Desulfatiferula olefinivorans]